MCRYVDFLANEGLSHVTIKGYLAAVRHLHIENDAGDPGISAMPKLELIIRGVKMCQASKVASRPRQPISVELLGKIQSVWAAAPSWDNTMLWAAASLCFFGFLRSGEITVPGDKSFDQARHLTCGDVTVDSLANPTMLRVKIKASKTDPFRLGVDIFVGQVGTLLCPVAAALKYLVMRGSHSGPFFHFKDKKPLTRSRFVEQVRRALSKAGVDSSPYSGNSCRSGAATTAARRGISDATIKMLGRWKSIAYQLYIKTPRNQLAETSRTLAQDNK